jgi:hypothetical protein
LYLLALIGGALIALVLLARLSFFHEGPQFVTWLFGSEHIDRPLIIWAATAFGGLCGGCSASLKWLYHTVAKQHWHQDRIIWRLVVPVLSSVLAVFTGLMIVSGIVPFISKTPFDNPAAGAGFGYFIGFFSDNVLAGLQRFALNTFGTVDKRGSEPKGLDDSQGETRQ